MRTQGEPYCESVRHTDAGDFYLTHAIWHNSYSGNHAYPLYAHSNKC